MEITTRQSSIKITARLSFYPLPHKKIIWKPCCTQQNFAWLALFIYCLLFIDLLLVGKLNYTQVLLSSN